MVALVFCRWIAETKGGGSMSVIRHLQYRSCALLGACAYNSTGRKYAPITEMRLITHKIITTFPKGSKMAEFLEEDCSAYLGQELNLSLTANMRL